MMRLFDLSKQMPVVDRLRAVGLFPGSIRLFFQRNEDSLDDPIEYERGG